MTDIRHNLSDTRGNSLGICFFKVAMRLFGPRFCCAFVWFVAFFYALFDKKAKKSAAPYLQSRFPDAKGISAWWHFYKFIVKQGQAVFLAHWARTTDKIQYEDVNPQYRDMFLLDTSDRPFILLLSHVGCWQAAIPRMQTMKRRVNLLIQANLNPHIAKLMEDARFHIIHNTDDFGGLLECAEVLQNGEALAIMGDRMPSDAPNALEITLHGRHVRIPQTPWFLSAKFHCPIYPVFTMMTDKPHIFKLIYVPPITVDFQLPRRPSPELFTPYIQQYQNAIDEIIEKYPYQVFHFEQQ